MWDLLEGIRRMNILYVYENKEEMKKDFRLKVDQMVNIGHTNFSVSWSSRTLRDGDDIYYHISAENPAKVKGLEYQKWYKVGQGWKLPQDTINLLSNHLKR